jgi:threonine dehydratase
MIPHVTLRDVEKAAERIAPHVHRTPVLRSTRIDSMVGARVFFKYESFQKVGAFKARGATNAVLSLSDDEAQAGTLTHSSGNHGAALAFASAIRSIPCTVVMPHGAPDVKVAAVRHYGADVVFCDHEEREDRTAALAASTGATVIHPFEHPDVIAGQGTVALEMLDDHPDLDLIVTPLGGGGLISGTIVTTAGITTNCRVIGAEPAAVDDAHRSMVTGVRQPGVVPASTIADGLRTGIGERAFDIMRAVGTEVVTVTEDEIVKAARLHLDYMKTVVEPSAAVGLAALLRSPEIVENRTIGVIVSGGNTDFRWLCDQLSTKTVMLPE